MTGARERGGERSGAAAPVRRYHFHFPGVIFIAVTLFVAVGALNSQNNLLFAALGLAIGGLLVSGIVSGVSLLGVRVEREAPAVWTAGQARGIRYRVTNVNRVFPAFGLHVEEAGSFGPGTAGATGLGRASAFVAHVGPRETVSVSAPVRPGARGGAALPAVRVWSTFPFGLARKSLTFRMPEAVEVRPASLPLQPDLIERLVARASAGVGVERAPGEGEDFFGLREYVAGDPARRIAWRVSARTGALLVRQHALPAPVRVWVVLRLAARSGDPESGIERAIALAGSLLRQADEAGIAVGLAVPAAGVLVPPRLERRQIDRVLGLLAGLDASGAAAPERFPEQAARLGRGAVCVVVHPGPVDAGFGPPHARHFSADAPHEWLAATGEAARILAFIDGAAGADRGRAA